MMHCQVLVHNDMLEIPSGNILKRWTVIAGASIPTPNEGVRPVAPVSDADTFMLDALWLAARKLVEKGKENWSAFDTAMTILEKGGNDVDEVARKTKLSTVSPQVSNCRRNNNFIEVFQNNIRLGALLNNLAKHLDELGRSITTTEYSKQMRFLLVYKITCNVSHNHKCTDTTLRSTTTYLYCHDFGVY
jgi:hypothetical protein